MKIEKLDKNIEKREIVVKWSEDCNKRIHIDIDYKNCAMIITEVDAGPTIDFDKLL